MIEGEEPMVTEALIDSETLIDDETIIDQVENESDLNKSE